MPIRNKSGNNLSPNFINLNFILEVKNIHINEILKLRSVYFYIQGKGT